jgi:hypothetical protein
MPGAKKNCFENNVSATDGRSLEDGWAFCKASTKHNISKFVRLLISPPAKEQTILEKVRLFNLISEYETKIFSFVAEMQFIGFG